MSIGRGQTPPLVKAGKRPGVWRKAVGSEPIENRIVVGTDLRWNRIAGTDDGDLLGHVPASSATQGKGCRPLMRGYRESGRIRETSLAGRPNSHYFASFLYIHLASSFHMPPQAA